MSEKRKELVVSAIENGTVIDHIPNDTVFQVISILNLDRTDKQVLFGTNFISAKYGKKGIIKIRDQFFANEEINKIALVAPTATLIEIRNYEVVSKKRVEIPKGIVKIIKCINPNCITNHQNIETRFEVRHVDDALRLHCHYCEKYTKQENFVFL